MSEDKETNLETEEASDDTSAKTTPPEANVPQSEKANTSEKEQKNEATALDDADANETTEPEPKTSLEEEFSRLKADYAEKYDQMLRTVAEYENAKKRAERSKEEFSKYAIEGVIKDIVPIVDSVERAIESTNESKDFNALSEGIQLIQKQLLDAFQNRNVLPIEAVGQNFDPTRHEAIMHIESDDVAENAVIAEFQRGYTLHDRIIRPSMVSVSKGKPEEESESTPHEEQSESFPDSDKKEALDNG